MAKKGKLNLGKFKFKKVKNAKGGLIKSLGLKKMGM